MQITPEIIQRFNSKWQLDPISGCHNWVGSKNADGYGRLYYQYKCFFAHRVAYIIKNGSIPKNMCVCHKCDNPACVRGDHLFAGTRADNMADMNKKGRHNPGKGSRHASAKLTEADIPVIRRRYNAGESATSIAKDYPVNADNLRKACKRETWKHVK